MEKQESYPGMSASRIWAVNIGLCWSKSAPGGPNTTAADDLLDEAETTHLKIEECQLTMASNTPSFRDAQGTPYKHLANRSGER